ncbi:MAG: Rpn family recombination-promoting nuclease/putative transposase [Lachnospiraceae bacterium]|nr:Rpn family recombination-promoting nuclease/putative transposase [Lachnospiraceae bacterium]
MFNAIVFKEPQTNWHMLSGKLAFRVNNDYLFRALLQFDNMVLKELIASLLRWNVKDITSAEIQNPIVLGESMADKYYVLDVKVMLNNSIILNLEMQILDENNWPERSLCYLCRIFDQLNRGGNYINIKPTYQIGFTDFAPVSGKGEFYAIYRMQNVKNHEEYTDKFTLSVVDLSYIELATEEDKASKLDQWAKMFKAQTWEELRMLAEANPAIDQAVTKIHFLTEEDRIREQMEAREEYYKIERTQKELMRREKEKNSRLEKELADQKKENADQKKRIAELEALLEAKS